MRVPGRMGRLVAQLDRMAFIHRAAAHVLAGWNAKIEDLAMKRELARHAFEDLEQAQKLSSQVRALTRSEQHSSVVRCGLAEAMRSIDDSRDPLEMIVGLYGVAKRDLLVAHHRLLRELDPILDPHLIAQLSLAATQLVRQLTWAEALGARTELARRFCAAFKAERGGEGDPIESDRAIWGPLDRVPHAARPERFRRGRPGELRPLALDSSRDPSGIGLMLHNSINGEYTTMELVSRSLYEHPDLPAPFHLHLARQAYDEARHAAALERAAAAFGVRYGDHPVYTLTYDLYYQYDACAPGSKRELLWRLLLRGTIDEGLALDDFAFQEKRREHLGQPELADLFRRLCADEIFHVEAALKWSRHLTGGDEALLLRERAYADASVNGVLDERRRRFVDAHPADAIAEVMHCRAVAANEARDPLPFGRSVNLGARRAATTTDADLAQLASFGYTGAA